MKINKSKRLFLILIFISFALKIFNFSIKNRVISIDTKNAQNLNYEIYNNIINDNLKQSKKDFMDLEQYQNQILHRIYEKKNILNQLIFKLNENKIKLINDKNIISKKLKLQNNKTIDLYKNNSKVPLPKIDKLNNSCSNILSVSKDIRDKRFGNISNTNSTLNYSQLNNKKVQIIIEESLPSTDYFIAKPNPNDLLELKNKIIDGKNMINKSFKEKLESTTNEIAENLKSEIRTIFSLNKGTLDKLNTVEKHKDDISKLLDKQYSYDFSFINDNLETSTEDDLDERIKYLGKKLDNKEKIRFSRRDIRKKDHLEIKELKKKIDENQEDEVFNIEDYSLDKLLKTF